MCGIAGFCDFTRDNDVPGWGAVGAAMGRTLARRGPDGSGVWRSRDCVLAHRRLAVIDPANGAQPMTVVLPEGECALCYNGELYNTPQLRRQVELRGVKLSTRTDTEVLLWQLILFGERALEQLEGIFAFAFWDGRRKELLLVRDRFGVKPLFYTKCGDALVFGSEPKALFAYPGVVAKTNAESWQELLALSPARTPGHGVFAGLKELRGGHLLRFAGDNIHTEPWFALESRPHTDSYEDTVVRVGELLSGAIRRQLVSDVPLATLLSGGLDSSLITAVAAKEMEGLATYSFDYTDNARYFTPSAFQPDADQPWVERMITACGTTHTTLTCPVPDLVTLLDQACTARDLPGMGDVDSSLLWFCREIRQRHTVVLSGECSDEIFGGYPWFHRQDMLEADTFPWSMDFSPRLGVLREDVVQKLGLEDYARWRYRQSVAEMPRLEGESPEEERRREVGWLNLNWFMANLLERKDRVSMWSGLEVRVPFCDHHLIAYVWNIPWAMKSRNGERKQVLRDGARGLLPEDVRTRPKSPYPKTHSPVFEALARRRLETILADKNAPIHAVADAKKLRAGLLLDCGSYGKPWFGQLMAGPQMLAWLIQLNGWMERFGVEGP